MLRVAAFQLPHGCGQAVHDITDENKIARLFAVTVNGDRQVLLHAPGKYGDDAGVLRKRMPLAGDSAIAKD